MTGILESRGLRLLSAVAKPAAERLMREDPSSRAVTATDAGYPRPPNTGVIASFGLRPVDP